jgi:hypothetical protein
MDPKLLSGRQALPRSVEAWIDPEASTAYIDPSPVPQTPRRGDAWTPTGDQCLPPSDVWTIATAGTSSSQCCAPLICVGGTCGLIQ